MTDRSAEPPPRIEPTHRALPSRAELEARARPRLLPGRPSWPITVLIGGFPIFWLLGLSSFAVVIMSVPMGIELLRRRPIKVPRGFLLWALFLLWTFASLIVLGVDPPNTIPDSATGRLLGFGMREMSYISVTVTMLYIGNLTEEELPQERLVRLLGWFFITVVAGGLLGMLAPTFEFTSPFEMVLPGSIRSNLYVQHLVHPTAAQVQELISAATPRPAAPFGYTNTWGFHITLLSIWFVVGWFLARGTLAKTLAVVVLLTGAVVLIYSLNRAAWIGAVLAVVYVVVRLAMHRRAMPLAASLLGVAVASVIFVATPLHDVVDQRLDAGKSDNIRAFTTERAIELSSRSPVIGYGSTRSAVGSASSIAVGKSADCPQCGNVSIGINGYFFMLLMSTGWVGAGLFFGFGGVQVWRARNDRSPVVMAGSLVILLTGFYGFLYDVSTWMLVPFVTLAILWRADQRRQSDNLAKSGR